METLNRSFEPMDIDMSSSVTDIMDMSFDIADGDWEVASVNLEDKTPTFGKLPVVEEISENRPNTIKKYHINFKSDINEFSKNYIKIIVVVFVLGLSLIIAPTLNVKCAEEMNTDYLKTDLNSKVYGQSKAIEALIDVLKMKESKLLILYGGTGVGKTYVASIIMERFGYSSNMYHYTMPSFNTEFSVDFLLGLTLCKSSMFIIDDLSKDDMHVKTSINNLVNKSKSMEKNVTIILIFNCMNTVGVFDKDCDKSFHNQLLMNFANVNAIMKVIKFEQLTEEHLGKCIENEIGYKITTNHDMRNIYKNFNVAMDGCKGVHAKMNLYKFIN